MSNRRPSYGSPDGLYSPYGAPSANPFEMDDLQQHRQGSSGVHEFPPTAASFYRSGQQSGYSPIPSTGYPYGRVPKRKSVASSTHTLETQSSAHSGVSASDTDLQQLLSRHEEPPPPPTAPTIYWLTPFSMVGLFLLGVLGAITHHLFYASLHGRDARNQLEKVRYGTAMAVFTKATLVGSVVVAYRQRIWYTFRRKALSLAAIDGLFAVVDDPMGFLTWGIWRGAKVATAMACAVW
jgi:hypothetical protein